MSALIGTLEVRNGTLVTQAELRRKEDQNHLSGIAYFVAGTSLSTLALASTCYVVGMVGETVLLNLGLSTGGMFISESESVLTNLWKVSIALIGNVAFVKGVADCFTNAIYHLGPDIEVVCDAPVLSDRIRTPILLDPDRVRVPKIYSFSH
jgi:hypothetical protein